MESRQEEKLSKSSEVAFESEQIEAGVSSCNKDVEERTQVIKDAMADRGINLTSEDIEVIRVYLASKPKWEEVYRRLADS